MITLFDDFLSVLNHDTFITAVHFLTSEVVDSILLAIDGNGVDTRLGALDLNLVDVGVSTVDYIYSSRCRLSWVH